MLIRRPEDGWDLPRLVWRLPRPCGFSSAPLGGGRRARALGDQRDGADVVPAATTRPPTWPSSPAARPRRAGVGLADRRGRQPRWRHRTEDRDPGLGDGRPRHADLGGRARRERHRRGHDQPGRGRRRTGPRRRDGGGLPGGDDQHRGLRPGAAQRRRAGQRGRHRDRGEVPGARGSSACRAPAPPTDAVTVLCPPDGPVATVRRTALDLGCPLARAVHGGGAASAVSAESSLRRRSGRRTGCRVTRRHGNDRYRRRRCIAPPPRQRRRRSACVRDPVLAAPHRRRGVAPPPAVPAVLLAVLRVGRRLRPGAATTWLWQSGPAGGRDRHPHPGPTARRRGRRDHALGDRRHRHGQRARPAARQRRQGLLRLGQGRAHRRPGDGQPGAAADRRHRHRASAAADAQPNCFPFRVPPAYAEHLKDAGFELLNLANNHANDFGPAGYANTQKALDAAGLKHTGAPARSPWSRSRASRSRSWASRRTPGPTA